MQDPQFHIFWKAKNVAWPNRRKIMIWWERISILVIMHEKFGLAVDNFPRSFIPVYNTCFLSMTLPPWNRFLLCHCKLLPTFFFLPQIIFSYPLQFFLIIASFSFYNSPFLCCASRKCRIFFCSTDLLVITRFVKGFTSATWTWVSFKVGAWHSI